MKRIEDTARARRTPYHGNCTGQYSQDSTRQNKDATPVRAYHHTGTSLYAPFFVTSHGALTQDLNAEGAFRNVVCFSKTNQTIKAMTAANCKPKLDRAYVMGRYTFESLANSYSRLQCTHLRISRVSNRVEFVVMCQNLRYIVNFARIVEY